MVTANIIATPRRKRTAVSNSPHIPKARQTEKFLEGIYFSKFWGYPQLLKFSSVLMKKSPSFTKEKFEDITKQITDFGGRIVSDITSFDIKTVRKDEEIYCVADSEKATPRYLSCLVYQIQTCRPKWIEGGEFEMF